jgi:putative membrane protein
MLATVLITVVALIHLYILVLEMFLWNTKTGHKAFNLRPDFARDTRVLAAQGLYNGFLAAGLLWSLWLGENGIQVAIFFLTCVLIAGLLAQPPPAVKFCTCRPFRARCAACVTHLKQCFG